MVGDSDLGEELDSPGSQSPSSQESKSQALGDWGRVRDKEGMCEKRFRKAGAPFCQGPTASSVEPKAEPHSSPMPSPAAEVLKDPQKCIYNRGSENYNAGTNRVHTLLSEAET